MQKTEDNKFASFAFHLRLHRSAIDPPFAIIDSMLQFFDEARSIVRGIHLLTNLRQRVNLKFLQTISEGAQEAFEGAIHVTAGKVQIKCEF